MGQGTWAGWQCAEQTGVQTICMANSAAGVAQALAIDADGRVMLAMEGAGVGFGPWWMAGRSKVLNGLALRLHGRDGRMVAIATDAAGRMLDHWFAVGDVGDAWDWTERDSMHVEGFTILERMTGGLEVYAIDASGELWHCWSTRDYTWSDWATLDGNVSDKVAVANNTEGYPEVFARMVDGGVGTRRHRNDGSWADWVGLGGSAVGAPCAVSDAEGRILALALDAEGRLHVCRQQDVLGEYGKWVELGGCATEIAGAVLDGDGCVHVVALDTEGCPMAIQWHRGRWGHWHPVGGAVRMITLGRHSDGHIAMVALGRDGMMYMR